MFNNNFKKFNVTRDFINKESNAYSSQSSSLTRTLSMAFGALCWGMVVSNDLKDFITQHMKVYFVVCFCVFAIALFFDFLQYFFGTIHYRKYSKILDKDKSDVISYRRDWLYVMLEKSHFLKYVFYILALVLFIPNIVRLIYRATSHLFF